VRPRLALAFVTLVLLAMGARLVTGPEERVAFTFYDDAYYYLGVAKHLAAGEGSTFDGINGTNGYHPLWCWLLVPIVALTHDPGTGVRAVAALWFALAAAVPWVVFWAARRRFGDRMAATVAVIFTTLPWLSLSLARPNGLETPLLAILVCLVLGTAERVVAHVDLPSSGGSVGLGALAGLATLTRLDAGFLAVAVAIATARRSYAKALLVAAAATLVAGPWLLWNELRFGSPLPVSGRVLALEAAKAREAHGGALSIGNLGERARIAAFDVPKLLAERALHGIPLPLAAGAAVLVLLGLGLNRWPELRWLNLFAALHYAAYVLWLWTPGEDVYRAYYFLPQVLLGSLLAAAGVESILARKAFTKNARASIAIVGIVLLSAHAVAQANAYARDLDAKPGAVASRFIYGWVKEHTPEGATLAARDSGKLGWFSGRRVINLDGLANDQWFFEALRAGTVDPYICERPIDYLLYDRPFVSTKLMDPGGPCRARDAGPATEDWVVLEVEHR